ncbi:RNA-binding S4 domain-containing protein [soil metagenome]
MDQVAISGDVIKLGQFLKLIDVIEQGSDAKLLLAEQRVRVNGEIEQRRGRQLHRGDRVQIDDQQFAVG